MSSGITPHLSFPEEQMYCSCSEGSVVLSGLDPTGMCVASDDTTIVATLTEVSTQFSAPVQCYNQISV